MADKENCVRLTRAAKRRAEADQFTRHVVPEPRVKKARTVLGEISNFSNPPGRPGSKTGLSSKPKCRPRKKTSKAEVSDRESKDEDPQMCAPYASDIYSYLRSMEVEPKRRPMLKYIERFQTDISSNMRTVLVDWLVEVAEEYKLVSDTLYLTIDYIDRYLSHCLIKRQRLQLLGVSCMLIASKYEEITPPHIEDFCYITDNTYTREEVQHMETDVLNFLKFELGNPTVKSFLRRFIHIAEMDTKLPNLQFEFLCNYLAELSLLEYECVQFLPSMVAAAVIFVSKFTINANAHPWNEAMQNYTGYRPSQLKDCILVIHELQHNRRARNVMAIREKYRDHKFKVVATLSSRLDIPMGYFEDINS